jgi:hypothetical protein
MGQHMEGMDVEGGSNRRLNRMVAVTVVILSITMALTKIKDDNIVQAMQADKAASVDVWSEYQASRIKLHIAQGFERLHSPGVDASSLDIAKYQRESQALKAKAAALDTDYDKQGFRDDQFDIADGFYSVALAVAAIAALIESYELLAFCWLTGFCGIGMGVAGFAELPIHPDALVRFLT